MKLILPILILLSFFTKAQSPQTIYEVTTIIQMQAYSGMAERIFVHDVNKDYILCSPCTVNGSSILAGAGGRKWKELSPSSTETIIAGGPIGRIPVAGDDPGTSLTTGQWIISAFYVTPPTATLTASEDVELTSASTIARTLNWSASRLSLTTPLATVIVAGVSKSFSQPAQPGTVSGTHAVTVPTNTTTTYSNVVTTTDGKTATASVVFTFKPKRYWFYSTVVAPTSSDINAALGGSSELTTTKVKATNFSVVVSGTSKYVSYAYPSSYGALSSIVVGGFESISAFNLTVRSLINGSGYTQNYNVYTSNNVFANTTITFSSVQ